MVPHSFTKTKTDIFTESYQVKKEFLFHFCYLSGWGGSWLLNIKWEPVMHADAQDIEQQRNTKFRGLMKFLSSECRAKPYRLHSRRDGGITAQCASRCQADSRCRTASPLPPPPPSKSIEKDTEQAVFVVYTLTHTQLPVFVSFRLSRYFESKCTKPSHCSLLRCSYFPKQEKLWQVTK